MTKRELLVDRLMSKPARVCRTLHHCCLCDKDITLAERYYDGGYGSRAHVDCIIDKCPRCGTKVDRAGDDEAGFQMASCPRNGCGWEAVA